MRMTCPIAWCRQAAAHGLASCLLALPLALGAAGAPPSDNLPDIAAERALVYSGEFDAAVRRLDELSQTVQHAEIYNLLGYSLRQLQRYDEAARAYQQALLLDPEHRPALEYQGELFIATGNIHGARQNLRYLELLCGGTGCVEYGLLGSALLKAGHPLTVRGAAP